MPFKFKLQLLCVSSMSHNLYDVFSGACKTQNSPERKHECFKPYSEKGALQPLVAEMSIAEIKNDRPKC